MSISTSGSSHVYFERSIHAAIQASMQLNNAKQASFGLQTSKWSSSYARCSKENSAMETSWSPFMGTLWDYTFCSWELYMPIWDSGVSRAAACTICSSQFLLRGAWNLGIVRLRTWPASASNMRKTTGGWRHRVASPSTQTSYQTRTFRNRHHFVTCSDVIPLRQQKSQLSLLVPSLWITWLNLASLASGCTIQHSTTLKWLTMVSNLEHPQL